MTSKVHFTSDWTFDRLARELYSSPSKIFRALRRAEACHLYDSNRKHIRKSELLSLLRVVRHIFPFEPAGIARGVLTGPSGPAALERMAVLPDAINYVWKDASSDIQGMVVKPIIPNATKLVYDTNMYSYLCLVDELRVGGARERVLALEDLENLLG